MESGEFWVLEFLKRETKKLKENLFYFILMRKNNIILICFVAMFFFHIYFSPPLIWELEFVKKTSTESKLCKFVCYDGVLVEF